MERHHILPHNVIIQPSWQHQFSSDSSGTRFHAGHTLAMSSSPFSIALSNRNWLADTGATSHMTPHRHWVHNYTPLRIPISEASIGELVVFK